MTTVSVSGRSLEQMALSAGSSEAEILTERDSLVQKKMLHDANEEIIQRAASKGGHCSTVAHGLRAKMNHSEYTGNDWEFADAAGEAFEKYGC